MRRRSLGSLVCKRDELACPLDLRGAGELNDMSSRRPRRRDRRGRGTLLVPPAVIATVQRCETRMYSMLLVGREARFLYSPI